MADDYKSIKLTIYLIKENYAVKANSTDFKEVLRTDKGYQEYNLNPDIVNEGLVVVGNEMNNEPTWLEFLQEGVQGQLDDLLNRSNRALMLIKVSNRVFAIPMGYGKYLLKEECIEREFGLKTVLNLIDADKLLSVDKANIGELSLQTRTQTSKKGTPDLFGIDVLSDLLRGITGEPKLIHNQLLGSVITGGEAVHISPKINIFHIPNILNTLLVEYQKDTYKDRFDWIDNIKEERDPKTIDRLREKLISELVDKKSDDVHLSPPYVIEWKDLEYVSYTRKGAPHYDFDIADFYKEKTASIGNLDWEKLSRNRIYIKMTEQDLIRQRLIDFINFNCELNGKQYVFAAGAWYQVDLPYYKQLYDYCSNFQESNSTFINCDHTENEEQYNEKLANSHQDFLKFDRDLVHSEISRSGIEVCDVFNLTEQEFIHVKFRNSSATLSHLFAQGRVAGSSLRKDTIFRRNLRRKLGVNRDLIPISNKSFVPGKYTITFALIDKKQRSFVDALPFFSLVNFRLTAENLNTMGFSVRVKNILVV